MNEVDKNGNGITVTANYKLLMTEIQYEVAQTRNLQLNIDEPLQYFFAFKWNTTLNSSTSNDEEFKSLKQISASSPYSVKYEVLPVKRN